MIHANTLKDAILAAIPGSLIWQKEETQLDIEGLLALAEEQDRQPLADGSFYVVSREGAIGLADRYEYRTCWLWLPLQGEELVSALTALGAQKKARHDADDAVVPMPEGEKAAALAAAEPPEAPAPEEPEQPAAAEPVCPSCGHVIRMGDRFCIFCGSPTAPKPVPESAPKNAFCMNCGSPLKPGDRFCMNCGAKV